MKKVLFVINNLKIGGVQRSLLNLLKELHGSYDITVLTFEKDKEDDSKLPPDVRLISAKPILRYLGVSQGELNGSPIKYCTRAFFVALTRLFGRSFALKIMFLFQKKIKSFDYAVSFLHEGTQSNLYGGCNEFVLKKVVANKKITWLHGDFLRCGANSKKNIKIYKNFDKIVACSEGTKDSFIKCVPELSSKCVVVRNCNDFDRIRALAKDAEVYDKGLFNIVTVSRLGEEKAIDRALIAVSECLKRGYRVHYHIVGDGSMTEKLKELCEEKGIEKSVTFYGNRQNPYRYIKNADLFLLPSYHEAAPMVFDEAACLGVPILATETTSTDEMIKNVGAGIVCENTQEGIEKALLEIVENKDCLNSIREGLKQRVFTNERIIETIKDELFN